VKFLQNLVDMVVVDLIKMKLVVVVVEEFEFVVDVIVEENLVVVVKRIVSLLWLLVLRY
jgi:hypothetical protein